MTDSSSTTGAMNTQTLLSKCIHPKIPNRLFANRFSLDVAGHTRLTLDIFA